MSEGLCKWFYIFRLTLSEKSDITIVQETGNIGLGESSRVTVGGEYIPRCFCLVQRKRRVGTIQARLFIPHFSQTLNQEIVVLRKLTSCSNFANCPFLSSFLYTPLEQHCFDI